MRYSILRDQEDATLSFTFSGNGVQVFVRPLLRFIHPSKSQTSLLEPIQGNSGPAYGAFVVQCDNEGVTNNAEAEDEHVQVLLYQRVRWTGGEHQCTITNAG